jgi:hypothetical protein
LRKVLIFIILILASVLSFGSSISNSMAFTGGSTTSTSIGALTGPLTGLMAEVNPSQGGLQTCVFTASNTCSVAGFFTLTDSGGNFTLTGTQSTGITLTSLEIVTGNAVAAFNPCITGGTVGASCASQSFIGSTATSIVGTPSGAGSASLLYTGSVLLPGQKTGGTTYADLFTNAIFTFASSGLASGTNFTFSADIVSLDGTGSDPPGVPEPATLGLVGASLVGLAGLKLRRSKRT